MENAPTKLASPAVISLRAQTAGLMERTLSQDIRDEREDLREAAEQTLNVIVDLNLDGTVRWVSPSWVDVIGTSPDGVQSKPISDIVVSEPTTIFTDVAESMKGDDSQSQFIRFSVRLGPLSKLLAAQDDTEDVPVAVENKETGVEEETDPQLGPGPGTEEEPDAEPQVVDLEAQGIMVHDTGGESHVSCTRPIHSPG